MKFKSEKLIEDLIERTRNAMNDVEALLLLSNEKLNQKSDAHSWSALECIAHLVFYSDFYNPEIKKRMDNSRSEPRPIFKSGLLGNFFSNLMLPKDNLNKMKTLKEANPLGSDLNKEILEKFKGQLKESLNLLNKARSKNLTKIKTGISISNMIKLRLGDTFRVVIYHNQRHLIQALKAAGLPPEYNIDLLEEQSQIR